MDDTIKKKSIIFNWMNSIFLAKTIPKEDFTTRKAHEVLSQANFNIPYKKDFEAYMKQLTAEFRTAFKEKRVAQLLDQYPLSKFVSEEGIIESDVSELKLDEPTTEEVKKYVFNFLRGVDDIEKTFTEYVLNHLNKKYKMLFKHRKSEIKNYIDEFYEQEEIQYLPELKIGDEVIYIKTDKEAKVIEVHKDDFPNLYYTIKIEDSGKEIQTVRTKLMVVPDWNEISDLEELIRFLSLTYIGGGVSTHYIIENLKRIYSDKRSWNNGSEFIKRYTKQIREFIEVSKEKYYIPVNDDKEEEIYKLRKLIISLRDEYVGCMKDNISDGTGRNQSFYKGEAEGFEKGYGTGYEKGSKDGYKEGSKDGYKNGRKDGSDSMTKQIKTGRWKLDDGRTVDVREI